MTLTDKFQHFIMSAQARVSNIDIVVEVETPSLTIMYELEQSLKALFKCNVDLVRYRQSLRPLFKSNIEKDVVFV